MANMIDGLFLAIFASNGIYIAITLFVGLNMPKCFNIPQNRFAFFFHQFYEFQKIKMHFQVMRKKKYKDYNKSSIDFTIGIWNSVCIARFVWCAM